MLLVVLKGWWVKLDRLVSNPCDVTCMYLNLTVESV